MVGNPACVVVALAVVDAEHILEHILEQIAILTFLTIHLVYPPPLPFFLNLHIVFNFSCDDCQSQEKLKTLLMGGQGTLWEREKSV